MDTDALREDMLAAVTDTLRKHDGDAFITKFIVLAEVVGDDSSRSLWTVASKDCKPWEVLGMLEFGKTLEYGAQAQAGSD